MEDVTIMYDDKVIRRSKNLRAIMNYARNNKAIAAHLLIQRGFTLFVIFGDGAWCRTRFSDRSVLFSWISDRVRYGRGKFTSEQPRTGLSSPVICLRG